MKRRDKGRVPIKECKPFIVIAEVTYINRLNNVVLTPANIFEYVDKTYVTFNFKNKQNIGCIAHRILYSCDLLPEKVGDRFRGVAVLNELNKYEFIPTHLLK